MTDPLLPDYNFPPAPPLPPGKARRPRWLVPLVIGACALAVTGAVVGATVVLPAVLDPLLSHEAAGRQAPVASAPAAPSSTAPSSTAAAPASAPASDAAAKADAFVAESAGFSAVFPTKPTKATAAQLGAQADTTQAYIAGDGVQSFTVTAVDMPCQPPAGEVAAGLAESTKTGIDAAAKSLNAEFTVQSETPREVAGHRGAQADYTLKFGSQTVKGRYVSLIAGKHFYAVAAMAPETNAAAWDAFIDSFKSLDADGTLPACAG